MGATEKRQAPAPPEKPITTYHEEKIKGTLYRVTSVYTGKIDLAKALEELTVRKVLALGNAAAQANR